MGLALCKVALGYVSAWTCFRTKLYVTLGSRERCWLQLTQALAPPLGAQETDDALCETRGRRVVTHETAVFREKKQEPSPPLES